MLSLPREPHRFGRPRLARWLTSLVLAAWVVGAWAQVVVPELSRRVTDLTATLDSTQVAGLEQRLAAFEAKTGSQIAVLIVPTTAPEDIAQFGIRVAEAWKIGREKIDDGVILIVAKDDRTLRIEVGYGLEGAIPDAIAKRVIAETIVPRFRAGDFHGGIAAGLEQLIRLIEGEPLPPPKAARGGGGGGDDDGFVLLVLGGIASGWLLSALMSRPAAGAIAALGSGAIGAWVLGVGLTAILVVIFVFIAVLAGFRQGGGWSSGGGGGLGGGFGGGGSWGGGGGGFGGGGASGSW